MEANKKILLAVLSASIVVGGYYFFKTRPRKYGLENEEAEIDFVNANGKRTLISDLKYQTELTRQLMFRNYDKFINKSVFTKLPNVNVRKSPEIKNGIFGNKAGQIANFNTFLGKVVEVKRDKSGKYLWFGINEINANRNLQKAFDWSVLKQPDSALRWFRSDVVVVKVD